MSTHYGSVNHKKLSMTLDDVKTYITRKNLNSKSSKRDVVDQRSYLYAYLYHFLKIENLSEIGRMFAPVNEIGEIEYNDDGSVKGAKGHVTVRHHLILTPDIQFEQEFIKNTKELHDQIPIIIPKYHGNLGRKKLPNVKKRAKEYEITVKVTRDQFYKYAKKKDIKVIFDLMFDHMMNSTPRANNVRNPNRKRISSNE